MPVNSSKWGLLTFILSLMALIESSHALIASGHFPKPGFGEIMKWIPSVFTDQFPRNFMVGI